MLSGVVEATSENISNWIKAGAAALNMGSNLIPKDMSKSEDFDGIRKRVEECVLWIRRLEEFLCPPELNILQFIQLGSDRLKE